MTAINPEKLPRHVAIIMDGNGRWAKERMLPRIVGHHRGVETVRTVVEECSSLGIPYLTLFAFSSENWLRPRAEVNALMALLKKYISIEIGRMLDNNIRFNVIGDRRDIPADVNQVVDAALEKTAGNGGMVLTLALSYGSRQEIMKAMASIAAEVCAGRLAPEEVTEERVSQYLYTAGLPDPDLLIRTSGEMRISNFLLWQIAYSEFYFSEVLWPDFTKDELHKALLVYQARERRFGRTSDQIRKRS